MPPASKTYDK